MEESTQPEGLLVRTLFVRNRNALVARAAFEDLYVDYYLGLASTGMRHIPEHDQLLKDALAAITLHAASRPWNETVAWTVNFQEPLLNLFVSGDNPRGGIIGNLFTEDVRKGDENLFYADTVTTREPLRRSVVSFEGSDIFRAAEHFYRQSEQRPARYLKLGEEEFVLVAAQPGCDVAWLDSLTDDAAATLEETETLSPLETRYYRWQCGCSEERIIEVMARAAGSTPDTLFEQSDELAISCPRCGARYTITREQVEEYLRRTMNEK